MTIKTTTDAQIEALQFVAGQPPATPDAGHIRMFANTAGKLAYKDDAGIVLPIGDIESITHLKSSGVQVVESATPQVIDMSLQYGDGSGWDDTTNEFDGVVGLWSINAYLRVTDWTYDSHAYFFTNGSGTFYMNWSVFGSYRIYSLAMDFYEPNDRIWQFYAGGNEIREACVQIKKWRQ